MALSVAENEMFTQVGPGTPGGEMLRRYWHPVGFSSELKGRPKRRRLLGENLVLFRDDRGRLGILELRCLHRGTSLAFGNAPTRFKSWPGSFLPISVPSQRRSCLAMMCSFERTECDR